MALKGHISVVQTLVLLSDSFFVPFGQVLRELYSFQTLVVLGITPSALPFLITIFLVLGTVSRQHSTQNSINLSSHLKLR